VKLLLVNTELTDSPKAAARFIRSGGIVAFPTETVYGLGADIFDPAAVAKIFEAKRRPADNPLIAHVGDLDQVEQLAREMPTSAARLIEVFFPGPLTVVLKKSGRVPAIATAGLNTIGIRMPGNKLANEFLRECATPVAAPSANISGRPSPTTWRAVFEDLDSRIDCILQGEPTDIGLESTVVDCTVDPPLVLRSGAVLLESLRKVVPGTAVYRANDTSVPRSPGMRHKHYAPRADVLLVEKLPDAYELENAAYIGLERPAGEVGSLLICGSIEDYARRVFAFFRDCDNEGIERIYCQTVPEAGLGVALMDRLRRAASG